MPETARTLFDGRSPYPERPQFFAAKFSRLAMRSGVALELGPDALLLLLFVAMTEDSVRYRKAPAFWSSQFREMLGLDRDRVRYLRQRLITAGWLHYERGRPSRYWVLIPASYDLDDARTPLGESAEFAALSPPTAANSAVSFALVPPFVPITSAQSAHILPVPVPEPESSSSVTEEEERRHRKQTEASASDDIAALAARASALGVNAATETVRSAIRGGLSPADVARILAHAEAQPVYQSRDGIPVRRWGGGAIRLRLVHPDYSRLPTDQGWASAHPDWTRLHARAQDARRRQSAAAQSQGEATGIQQRRSELRQLEIDWGPRLERLSSAECLALVQRLHLADTSNPLVRRGIEQRGARLPLIRPALLRAFAAGLIGEN